MHFLSTKIKWYLKAFDLSIFPTHHLNLDKSSQYSNRTAIQFDCKMIAVAFVTILALELANANSIQTGEILPGRGCLDYTINQCDFGQPHATIFNEGFESCSMICNSQIDCKFFTFDHKKIQCDTYFTQESLDFRTSCDELAGPNGNGTLSIAQCTNSPSDPCKAIHTTPQYQLLNQKKASNNFSLLSLLRVSN